MKKIAIALIGLTLGIILGCVSSFFVFSGGGTFWERLDYFPYPVERIIIMEPFGEEFWVESMDNESYHVTYPCFEGKPCWQKTDVVPESFDFKEGPVDYDVSDTVCENDDFVYPLFRPINVCITSTVLAADAYWRTSLVLTKNHELWIWQKPWESPYSVFDAMIGLSFVGAIAGLCIGMYLAASRT